MQLILKVADYSSSTWYEKPLAGQGIKPRPKPAIDDEEALQLIKKDLQNSKFNSEGYLKVKKRLAKTNKHIAKHRVNLLMREHNLLSPNRPVKNGSKRTHDGKIITDRPDKMWGTDGKKFWAGKDGWCWSCRAAFTISAIGELSMYCKNDRNDCTPIEYNSRIRAPSRERPISFKAYTTKTGNFTNFSVLRLLALFLPEAYLKAHSPRLLSIDLLPPVFHQKP